MHLLRLLKTNSGKISALSLINLVGISVFCVVLFDCIILFSFRIATFSRNEKLKIPILRNNFNDRITNTFRCSVNLIKLWNVQIGFDIRKEFIQSLDSFFITLYNFITLNNCTFLIRDNFI